MPSLTLRSAGYVVTEVDWNDILNDLNSLTAVLTGSSGKLGVGTVLPSMQLHVYGLGQTTADLADSGNKLGTVYVQDSGGAPGNGGAVVFGAVTGHFAAVKSHLLDGSGNTIGDLVVSLRRTTSDNALTECLRVRYNDGRVQLNQLYAYGQGQLTANWSDGGAQGGTIRVQDSDGAAGNGGAVLFGAAGSGTAYFAAIKSLIDNGSGNTTGDLVISLRRSTSDAFLTENTRFVSNGTVMFSSAMTHSFTTLAPASVYAYFGANDANGTCNMFGFGGATAKTGLSLFGYAGDEDTTKGTGSVGSVTITSGAPGGLIGGNANILAVRNSTITRFILDADGDSHQDVGTAWSNFDDYDDVSLLTAISAAVSRDQDPLRHQFADVLESNRDALERSRIVSFNDDGQNFVNWSRMSMLLVGAVRQLGRELDSVKAQMKALEA